MKQHRLSHQFVEFVPDAMDDGVLYVSMSYAIAAHRCACGCGREVVTPLSPTDWRLIFNGESVSLDPSIGNWSFPCRSHYFIREGRVQWAASMTEAAIQRGRSRDRAAKEAHFASRSEIPSKPPESSPSKIAGDAAQSKEKPKSRLNWLGRLFQ
jgi:hypothetical protein